MATGRAASALPIPFSIYGINAAAMSLYIDASAFPRPGSATITTITISEIIIAYSTRP
jgi:hypothetical protein